MPGIDNTGSTGQIFQAAFDVTSQSLKVLTIGSLTGVNAASNVVGYVQSSTLARASAVSLTTATPANVIASITIPAGSWMISGAIGFIPAATTSVTQLQAAVSKTTAALPANTAEALTDGTGQYLTVINTAANVLGADYVLPIPAYPFFTSTSVTVFLVAQAAFTVSTLTAFGSLYALRIR
jgi:hypothetical protein